MLLLKKHCINTSIDESIPLSRCYLNGAKVLQIRGEYLKALSNYIKSIKIKCFYNSSWFLIFTLLIPHKIFILIYDKRKSRTLMLINIDYNVIEIVILSLQVSLFAIFISCIISMPLARFLSSNNFLGKDAIIIIINALMSLPPVVVGLFLYLILSSQGFLSSYKILYTPSAMIIAQIIIITPILIALSKESIDFFIKNIIIILSPLDYLVYLLLKRLFGKRDILY